jgi:PAS domain S-box-containing protein
MIFDKENKPIDFIYLEVNDAFTKLTGLKKEAVINRKVTEVIPGIEKVNPELFEIYGRVALTGKEEKFEIFLEPLKLWLSVDAYSPEKNCFIAIFENITERKNADLELRRTFEVLERVGEGIDADIHVEKWRFKSVFTIHILNVMLAFTSELSTLVFT